MSFQGRNGAVMKRVIVLALICCMALCMAGCDKVKDLSEEENHLIAEYAAEMLLKYNRKYHMKYNPDAVADEEITVSVTETTTEETTTEEPTTEETTTEEVTTEKATTEKSDKDKDSTEEKTTESGSGDGDDHKVTPEIPSTEESSGVVADQGKDYDISEIIGEDNVSVKYAYYILADSYPSYDQDGVYIEIQAPSGHKLLVLKFAIENKTNEEQNIDFYSKDIGYNIIINNSKTAKQMLTILIDDLYTYQTKLDASDRDEAVLLFSVSDTIASSLTDIKLKVSNKNGKEATLQLEN